jgi:Arc/MetJ-type ribon-helix-helix transcriptional regulator
MVMARKQTLVQLSDDLLSMLDTRAAHERISRSELIRRAIDAYLADDRRAEIDRQIIAGYTRNPPPTTDAWGDLSEQNLVAAILSAQLLDEEDGGWDRR